MFPNLIETYNSFSLRDVFKIPVNILFYTLWEIYVNVNT